MNSSGNNAVRRNERQNQLSSLTFTVIPPPLALSIYKYAGRS
jgi:hypothetical protein